MGNLDEAATEVITDAAADLLTNPQVIDDELRKFNAIVDDLALKGKAVIASLRRDMVKTWSALSEQYDDIRASLGLSTDEAYDRGIAALTPVQKLIHGHCSNAVNVLHDQCIATEVACEFALGNSQQQLDATKHFLNHYVQVSTRAVTTTHQVMGEVHSALRRRMEALEEGLASLALLVEETRDASYRASTSRLPASAQSHLASGCSTRSSSPPLSVRSSPSARSSTFVAMRNQPRIATLIREGNTLAAIQLSQETAGASLEEIAQSALGGPSPGGFESDRRGNPVEGGVPCFSGPIQMLHMMPCIVPPQPSPFNPPWLALPHPISTPGLSLQYGPLPEVVTTTPTTPELTLQHRPAPEVCELFIAEE